MGNILLSKNGNTSTGIGGSGSALLNRINSRASMDSEISNNVESDDAIAKAWKKRRKRNSQTGLFEIIDIDNSGLLTKEELLQFAQVRLGLRGQAALDRINAIFQKYDASGNNEIDLVEFNEMIKSKIPDLTRGELKNTVKPKHLVKWFNSGLNAMMIALYFELDESIGNAVSDTSALSAYGSNHSADFFRRLVHAVPTVIDFLAVAPQTEVDAFQRLFFYIMQAETSLGQEGTFSSLTVPIDRAPTAYWLAFEASESNRLVYKTVFSSLATASSKKVWHYQQQRYSKIFAKETDTKTSHLSQV